MQRELGIRGVLSLPLVTDRLRGSLNLYSSVAGAFDPSGVPEAQALAAHIAVAMEAAQSKDGLETAVVNRTVIGQAEAILMQRYGVSADEAFAVLARTSQAANRKLIDIARQIAEARVDPDVVLGSIRQTDG